MNFANLGRAAGGVDRPRSIPLKSNEYCLIDSPRATAAGATRFSIEQSEPGACYVIEVLESRHAALTYCV
jgi:hypothetical protein